MTLLDQPTATLDIVTDQQRNAGDNSETPSKSLNWILGRARLLASARALQGQSWSLAQACDHLASSIASTVRGSAAEGPPRRWRQLGLVQRVTRWFIKHAMLITGWFPRGVPAPPSVTPAEEVSLEDAMGRLETAIAEFNQKRRDPTSPWGYHSLLGKMNGNAWHRFHHIHAAHHYAFFDKSNAA